MGIAWDKIELHGDGIGMEKYYGDGAGMRMNVNTVSLFSLSIVCYMSQWYWLFEIQIWTDAAKLTIIM